MNRINVATKSISNIYENQTLHVFGMQLALGIPS